MFELPEKLLPKPSWVKITQIRTLIDYADLGRIIILFDLLVATDILPVPDFAKAFQLSLG